MKNRWVAKYQSQARKRFSDEELKEMERDALEITKYDRYTFCRRHRISNLQVTEKQKPRDRLGTLSGLSIAASPVTRQRFPTHRKRNQRCEYCQLPGGELDCVFCNVIAHAKCFASLVDHEQLVYVVTPQHSSTWCCDMCCETLAREHHESVAKAREYWEFYLKSRSATRLQAFFKSRVIARRFYRTKLAVCLIQAMIRGKVARIRYDKIQRSMIRPYSIQLGRVETKTENNTLYWVINVWDNRQQVFLLESTEVVTTSDTVFFVPGTSGYAVIVLTLLKKAGPKTYFRGQTIVRLPYDGDVVLSEYMDRHPKKAMEIKPPLKTWTTEWTVSLKIQEYPMQSTLCGHLELCASVERVSGQKRWCVLVNNKLFLYRNYGLTVPSETIEISSAKTIRIVQTGRLQSTSKSIAIDQMDRLWLLRSDSTRDLKQWLRRLQFTKSNFKS